MPITTVSNTLNQKFAKRKQAKAKPVQPTPEPQPITIKEDSIDDDSITTEYLATQSKQFIDDYALRVHSVKLNRSHTKANMIAALLEEIS